MYLKQFGGRITPELISQYQDSANWKNGRFQNLEETRLAASLLKIPSIIYKQLANRRDKEPKKPLTVQKLDKNTFLEPAPECKFVWYGHSVVMIRMNSMSILIDPMFGDNTTPIAPFPTRRFSNDTLSIIDELPEIDLILITHDHYDHLDYASIQKLKNKTKKYFVAMGVKRHLLRWGVSKEKIIEFDWWNEQLIQDIRITFTPTRHFSGRRLTDRQKSLWGGWILKSSSENIWFSGDGGYGSHFKEIGKRLGPFDLAFMECGQYNEDWRPVHLFPDESVQAALDAGVKKAVPVHWGGFYLSYQHSWSEPADDFIKYAEEKKLNYITPELGRVCSAGTQSSTKWWNNIQPIY